MDFRHALAADHRARARRGGRSRSRHAARRRRRARRGTPGGEAVPRRGSGPHRDAGAARAAQPGAAVVRARGRLVGLGKAPGRARDGGRGRRDPDAGRRRRRGGRVHEVPAREGRTQVVFGVGNADADVMFIGEAPGFHEDKQGEPFVGAAGQLLTRMLDEVLGLDRDDVYICNVLKCRPPGNRDPQEDEIESCTPWLVEQVSLIQPRVIVTLGNFATKFVLQTAARDHADARARLPVARPDGDPDVPSRGDPARRRRVVAAVRSSSARTSSWCGTPSRTLSREPAAPRPPGPRDPRAIGARGGRTERPRSSSSCSDHASSSIETETADETRDGRRGPRDSCCSRATRWCSRATSERGRPRWSRGSGAASGVEDHVASPTFTLVRSTPGRLDVAHVDVYRLERVQDVVDLGAGRARRPGSGAPRSSGGTRSQDLLPEDRLRVELTTRAGR